MATRLSATAKAFIPGAASHPITQLQAWGDAPPVSTSGYTDTTPMHSDISHIQYLQDIIYQVSVSPGNFEEYMNSLVERLNASLTDPRQLADVADIVFDQSVLEPNFTYTGAKMCEYLQKHLVLKENFTEFRKHVNKRAKDICQNREIMVMHPEDVHMLRGATVFLTELFLNSSVTPPSGQTTKIHIYREAQKELMATLSRNASPENYKCLGQIFKLAGRVLEDYDKEKENSKSSTAITDVFKYAKEVVIDGTLERDVRQMWVQLIESRASDWGRAKSSSHRASSGPTNVNSQGSGSGAVASDVPFTNEPVFYGADGQVITAAEAGFGNVDFEGEFETFGPGEGSSHNQAFVPEEGTSYDKMFVPGESSSFDQYVVDDDDVDDYKQLEDAIAAATVGGGDQYGDWDPEVEAAFEQFQEESARGYHSNYR